ncbi:UUP1 family membrane protein [Wenzhouxiangella sp. AB-CW3]|uniref:UUP1 family membrane protein n=1 Tax=Wenzhouxiangella sp. AB-CW3 TaxID=2771012 RepID=UPI00168BB12F|nr:UUP1 family membrane protein [Wenzhouxiangella sp. AB-CW3]QOC22713.1 UUP1 family membrane protein [Wenzhouxiangella sp. AB-CW3]
MSQRLHWLLISIGLVLAGLAIVAHKHLSLGYPLLPDQTEASWTAEVRLAIQPEGGPVKVELDLPSVTPGLGRLRENFISRGYGLTTSEDRWSRTANWAVRRASQRQLLYYSGVFYPDRGEEDFAPVPPYPPVPRMSEPFATAMETIVEDVRRQSADISSFAAEMVARINSPSPSEEIALFLDSEQYRDNPVRVARTLLAGARIPTEQVNGFTLTHSERRAQPEQLLAVHNGREWLFFDPGTGRRGLPENFLIWWRGEQPVLAIDGAQLAELSWSIRRNELGALDLADQRASARDAWPSRLSMLDLPVQAQTVYAVLLLVPVGGFIMVLMRNLVGLRSFGTFMPVLIALAFRETGLTGGLVLFSLVVGAGLLLRFYLERLRLLLVPRLTAVLIIVVALMVLLSLISHQLGWEVGLSVGLFPMVIMAMVIERMSIVWEERGPGEALVEAAGTAVIASLAFFVMSRDHVQHLVFVFPEMLLAILGLTLLMGRYSGYRLSELLRFRRLAKEL